VAQEERLLTTQTRNQVLLTELIRSRGVLLDAVDNLTDKQMLLPIDGGWSIKDHLIHITVWDEMRFFEISRIARGGDAGFPAMPDEADIEWLNQPTVAMRRRLSLKQVILDLAYARDVVLQAVAICPEDRLDVSLYEEIGIEGGAAHDLTHAETILAWRKKEGI
jgi:hypothetical protein